MDDFSVCSSSFLSSSCCSSFSNLSSSIHSPETILKDAVQNVCKPSLNDLNFNKDFLTSYFSNFLNFSKQKKLEEMEKVEKAKEDVQNAIKSSIHMNMSEMHDSLCWLNSAEYNFIDLFEEIKELKTFSTKIKKTAVEPFDTFKNNLVIIKRVYELSFLVRLISQFFVLTKKLKILLDDNYENFSKLSGVLKELEQLLKTTNLHELNFLSEEIKSFKNISFNLKEKANEKFINGIHNNDKLAIEISLDFLLKFQLLRKSLSVYLQDVINDVVLTLNLQEIDSNSSNSSNFLNAFFVNLKKFYENVFNHFQKIALVDFAIHNAEGTKEEKDFVYAEVLKQLNQKSFAFFFLKKSIFQFNKMLSDSTNEIKHFRRSLIVEYPTFYEHINQIFQKFLNFAEENIEKFEGISIYFGEEERSLFFECTISIEMKFFEGAFLRLTQPIHLMFPNVESLPSGSSYFSSSLSSFFSSSFPSFSSTFSSTNNAPSFTSLPTVADIKSYIQILHNEIKNCAKSKDLHLRILEMSRYSINMLFSCVKNLIDFSSLKISLIFLIAPKSCENFILVISKKPPKNFERNAKIISFFFILQNALFDFFYDKEEYKGMLNESIDNFKDVKERILSTLEDDIFKIVMEGCIKNMVFNFKNSEHIQNFYQLCETLSQNYLCQLSTTHLFQLSKSLSTRIIFAIMAHICVIKDMDKQKRKILSDSFDKIKAALTFLFINFETSLKKEIVLFNSLRDLIMTNTEEISHSFIYQNNIFFLSKSLFFFHLFSRASNKFEDFLSHSRLSEMNIAKKIEKSLHEKFVDCEKIDEISSDLKMKSLTLDEKEEIKKEEELIKSTFSQEKEEIDEDDLSSVSSLTSFSSLDSSFQSSLCENQNENNTLQSAVFSKSEKLEESFLMSLLSNYMNEFFNRNENCVEQKSNDYLIDNYCENNIDNTFVKNFINFIIQNEQ